MHNRLSIYVGIFDHSNFTGFAVNVSSG